MFNRTYICIILIGLIASLFFISNTSVALVTTDGCTGGDLGDNCSLAELTADPAHFIKIDETVFDGFIFIDQWPRQADTGTIRVVPLGEGSISPGFRLEPAVGNTDWLYEYCVLDNFGIYSGNLQFNAHRDQLLDNQIIQFVVDADFESVWRSTGDLNDPIEGGVLAASVYRSATMDGTLIQGLQGWFCEPAGWNPSICGISDDLPFEKWMPSTNAQAFRTEFFIDGYVIDGSDPFACTVTAEIHNLDHRVILEEVPQNPFNPYDTNPQDWVIGDFELLDAIDGWAIGNLGDFGLLDLIDFWAAGCYQWDAVTSNHNAGC